MILRQCPDMNRVKDNVIIMFLLIIKIAIFMHLSSCTLAYIIHILCGSADVLKNKKAITEIISQ